VNQDVDYPKLKQELETIISWFEDSNHNLDESFEKYQRTQEIISLMERYLEDSQKKLQVISKLIHKIKCFTY